MTGATTTTTPPIRPRQDARKQWLEQSVLRRMVTPVKKTLSDIVAVSPFLRSPPPTTTNDPCAVFCRHELELHPTPLGTGSFATVHEIVAISLDDDIQASLTLAEQQRRESMRANVVDDHGIPRFVMKHLQNKVLSLSDPQVFQGALRDLAIEVEYMRRFAPHEHILPLLGRPLDGLDAMIGGGYDSFFLITERLDTTLHYKIKEWNVSDNPPSIEQRVPYMEQLATAITYLHQHRIIFRDLKPANVGIVTTNDGTDSIKLFDFGLCRELPEEDNGNDDTTTTNEEDQVYVMSGVGTQRYMASEVLQEAPFNCKVDVYSWALVSWEVLTGVRPYWRYGNASHKTAVLEQSERPRLPVTWPAWLTNVLTKSWCREIPQRVTMEQALELVQQRHLTTTTTRRSRGGSCVITATTISDGTKKGAPRTAVGGTWRVSSARWNIFSAQAE